MDGNEGGQEKKIETNRNKHTGAEEKVGEEGGCTHVIHAERPKNGASSRGDRGRGSRCGGCGTQGTDGQEGGDKEGGGGNGVALQLL